MTIQPTVLCESNANEIHNFSELFDEKLRYFAQSEFAAKSGFSRCAYCNEPHEILLLKVLRVKYQMFNFWIVSVAVNF